MPSTQIGRMMRVTPHLQQQHGEHPGGIPFGGVGGSRCGRRSAAGRAPRATGGVDGERGDALLREGREHALQFAAVGVEREVAGLVARVVHARQRAATVGRGSRPSPTRKLVRVRWRSSSSDPLSTALPARTIVTRSHSCSTSLRMWLEQQHRRALVLHALDLGAEHATPSPGRARWWARRRCRAWRGGRRPPPGRPSAGCPSSTRARLLAGVEARTSR